MQRKSNTRQADSFPPRAVLALAAALFTTLASAQSASDVQTENPRAFGHFVGDILARHIALTVPRPFAIAPDGLPKPGRLNAWIELHDVAVRATREPQHTRYHVDLTYQVINSPVQTRVATLPGVRLKFSSADKSFDTSIAEWPVTIAPLAGGAVRSGLEEIRPPHAPQLIDSGASAIRLALWLAIAAALLLAAAVNHFGMPWLSRYQGPFANAHRALRKLARRPAGNETFRSALRALHRAFDQTAGVRVFPGELDGFFTRHGNFADLRAAAQRFFEISNREFFAGGVEGSEQRIDWLLELCAQYRARERL
jgi:mxaA protein